MSTTSTWTATAHSRSCSARRLRPATKRIHIGTSVLIAPIRHPLHIAEEAALLDGISDGRVELGLGAGYLPIDFTPFGVERAKRFRMLDDAIPEIRRLLDRGRDAAADAGTAPDLGRIRRSDRRPTAPD